MDVSALSVDIDRDVSTGAPVLTSLSMSTDNADTSMAKTGNRLTLSFSANENLDPNSLELKLNGVNKKPSRSGSKWEHSYAPTYFLIC